MLYTVCYVIYSILLLSIIIYNEFFIIFSGRDRRDPFERDLDYAFRKGPMNADSRVDYDDFGIKKHKRQRSKTEEYFDPFGKMKKPKRFGSKGRSKTWGELTCSLKF